MNQQTTPKGDPAYWRSRAEDARRNAAESNDPEVKSVLEEIARAYERPAEITASLPK